MSPAILSLIILVVCIVLFLTRVIPNAVTACLGCLLFAITGICSFDEAFSGFSNSIVILVFGMMVVGNAMMDTGAAKLIGEKVTSLSRSNEVLFILLAGTVSALLSTFLSNTAVIAIFLPIIASVCQANPEAMRRRHLTLPVTMGAMFGGVCTLVGSTPQLTANGILSKMTGQELGMFDYMLPGAIIFLVYIIYATVIGPKISDKIFDKADEKAVTAEDLATQEIKVNKKKLVIMVVIFIATIISFIGGWISTAMTAVIAAILCVVTRCTTQKSIIKNMDWSVLFILAGCLGIASGITEGGAGELMSDIISKFIQPDISPIIIFAIFVLLTMIISNFITNSTAVVITLPIALALCSSHGLNPLTFTLGIVYAANLTFSTPLANAQTAMTLVAGYKFSDYIKYTWLLDILVFVAIILVVPMVMPLI